MIKLTGCFLFLFIFSFPFTNSGAQTRASKSVAQDSIAVHVIHYTSDQEYTQAYHSRQIPFPYAIITVSDTLAGIPIRKSGVVMNYKVVIPFFNYDSISHSTDNEFICRKHLVARRFYACTYLIVDALKGIISDPAADKITYIDKHVYDIQKNHTHMLFNSITKKSSPAFDSYSVVESTFIVSNRAEEHLLYDLSASPVVSVPFKTVQQTDTSIYKAVLYATWDLYQNTGVKLYTKLACDSIHTDTTAEKVWQLYRNGRVYYRRHITASYAGNRVAYNSSDNTSPVSDTAVSNRIKRRLSVDSIYFSSDGLFLYKKNKQYGYCDSMGNVKITHQYDTLTPWHDGMTAMRFKGKWGYLNKREKLTVQPYYITALPFYKDAALVYDGKRWSFINKEGKAVNSTNFDSLKQTPSGRWYVYSKGKIGLCESNGKELLPPTFEFLYDAGSDLIVYKSESLYGLILKDRTVVSKPVYDQFIPDETNDCYLLKHMQESPLVFSIPVTK